MLSQWTGKYIFLHIYKNTSIINIYMYWYIKVYLIYFFSWKCIHLYIYVHADEHRHYSKCMHLNLCDSKLGLKTSVDRVHTWSAFFTSISHLPKRIKTYDYFPHNFSFQELLHQLRQSDLNLNRSAQFKKPSCFCSGRFSLKGNIELVFPIGKQNTAAELKLKHWKFQFCRLFCSAYCGQIWFAWESLNQI